MASRTFTIRPNKDKPGEWQCFSLRTDDASSFSLIAEGSIQEVTNVIRLIVVMELEL